MYLKTLAMVQGDSYPATSTPYLARTCACAVRARETTRQKQAPPSNKSTWDSIIMANQHTPVMDGGSLLRLPPPPIDKKTTTNYPIFLKRKR